jgi:cytochrome c oxidase subunit 2
MIEPLQPLNRPSSRYSIVWKICIVAVAAIVIILLPIPISSQAPVDKHIKIEAGRFQFSPSEMTVNPGDRVTIEFTSIDVVHGLSLDGYNFELKADPGKTVSKSFIADKTGTFRFRCSVVCGNLHPFMIGKLQVGPNLLFVRGIALGLLAIITGIWTLNRKTKSGIS